MEVKKLFLILLVTFLTGCASSGVIDKNACPQPYPYPQANADRVYPCSYPCDGEPMYVSGCGRCARAPQRCAPSCAVPPAWTSTYACPATRLYSANCTFPRARVCSSNCTVE